MNFEAFWNGGGDRWRSTSLGQIQGVLRFFTQIQSDKEDIKGSFPIFFQDNSGIFEQRLSRRSSAGIWTEFVVLEGEKKGKNQVNIMWHF